MTPSGDKRDRGGPSGRRRRRDSRARRSRRWLVGIGLAATVVIIAITLRANRASTTAGIAVLQTADFHALTFLPDKPNAVLFGHHNGVMRSDDGGHTWKPLVAQPNFDAMGLAVSRGAAERIYLAGHNVFMMSDDGGISWRPVPHDLPGTDIHAFAASPTDPARLYAFVVGYGTFTSMDGGRRWELRPGNLPRDLMALAVGGGKPEALYAGSMRLGMLRSSDGGGTWASVEGLPFSQILTVAVDPARPETVYAGGAEGLAKSTNGGATWQKLPFPGRNAVAVAVNPSRPGTILAVAVEGGRGVVHRSLDGGLSWDARP